VRCPSFTSSRPKGRSTENLGTYVWAFLRPALRAEFVLREHVDGKNRFALPLMSQIGDWVVNALSATFAGEDPKPKQGPRGEIPWRHYWGTVTPENGPRRVHPPQGAHAARRMGPSSMWLLGALLRNYDSITAEHLMWAARPHNDDFEFEEPPGARYRCLHQFRRVEEWCVPLHRPQRAGKAAPKSWIRAARRSRSPARGSPGATGRTWFFAIHQPSVTGRAIRRSREPPASSARLAAAAGRAPQPHQIFEYAVSAVNGNGEGPRCTAVDTDPASWRNWDPQPGEGFRRRHNFVFTIGAGMNFKGIGEDQEIDRYYPQ
jgi:hypothetical protein